MMKVKHYRVRYTDYENETHTITVISYSPLGAKYVAIESFNAKEVLNVMEV